MTSNEAVTPEHGNSERFTPASRFTIDYLGSPPGLSDYVTTFYHFRCEDDEIRDIQPAAIGHLALFPLGQGLMSVPGGDFDPSHEVNLMTPFSHAAPFLVDGPFHAIGAALSPLGWAALTGLDAKEHGNRLYDAGEKIDPEFTTVGRELCRRYREGEVTGQQCVSELGRLILKHARPLKPGHSELIAVVNSWLSAELLPDLEKLYASSPYSQRQTQRLVERYFGLSPVALRRKYRALRAATLLSLPTLTSEFEAQIGEAFYDQSHMIREIRAFAGRTPARLGDDESPYLNEMLDEKNLRELRMPEALSQRDANDSQ